LHIKISTGRVYLTGRPSRQDLPAISTADNKKDGAYHRLHQECRLSVDIRGLALQ